MPEKKKATPARPRKKPPAKSAEPAPDAAQAPKAEAAPRPPPRSAARLRETGPHASLSFLRVAPRKVRLVADNVRGMKVGEALALLRYTPQAAAKPLAKLLRSAVANAEQKGGRVDVDALYVKT